MAANELGKGAQALMVLAAAAIVAAAIKLAELHGCELVDGAELPRLRSILRRLTAQEVS